MTASGEVCQSSWQALRAEVVAASLCSSSGREGWYACDGLYSKHEFELLHISLKMSRADQLQVGHHYSKIAVLVMAKNVMAN